MYIIKVHNFKINILICLDTFSGFRSFLKNLNMSELPHTSFLVCANILLVQPYSNIEMWTRIWKTCGFIPLRICGLMTDYSSRQLLANYLNTQLAASMVTSNIVSRCSQCKDCTSIVYLMELSDGLREAGRIVLY